MSSPLLHSNFGEISIPQISDDALQNLRRSIVPLIRTSQFSLSDKYPMSFAFRFDEKDKDYNRCMFNLSDETHFYPTNLKVLGKIQTYHRLGEVWNTALSRNSKMNYLLQNSKLTQEDLLRAEIEMGKGSNDSDLVNSSLDMESVLESAKKQGMLQAFFDTKVDVTDDHYFAARESEIIPQIPANYHGIAKGYFVDQMLTMGGEEKQNQMEAIEQGFHVAVTTLYSFDSEMVRGGF